MSGEDSRTIWQFDDFRFWKFDNLTIFSERGNLPRGVEKGDLQLGLRRLAPNSQTGEKQWKIGEICFLLSIVIWKIFKFYLKSSNSHNVQNMKYVKDIIDENQSHSYFQGCFCCEQVRLCVGSNSCGLPFRNYLPTKMTKTWCLNFFTFIIDIISSMF